MNDIILTYTTTDSSTNHEINLTKKVHDVEIKSDDGTVEKTTKKWGTQKKLVDKLIVEEIEKLEGKIATEIHTIRECIKYNSMGGLDITKRKLELNKKKLSLLTSYIEEEKLEKT